MAEMNDNEMKHALKKLGHYVKRYAFQYFIGILSLIAVDFFNTLIPQITGLITDGLASVAFAR